MYPQPQDTSCVINIELGGTIAGSSYDQLNVSGQAFLDGTLNISLIDNFIPVVGDTFEIMTFGTVSGMFTAINGLYTGTGVLFDLIPSSTSMQLVTTGAPNHPPVIINPISNHFQDEDFGTIWVAHLDSVFDDSDISLGDGLTYQVVIEGNALNGAINNRELHISSVSDSNGVVPVVVTATDMSSTSVSDTFDVTIVPVDDSPSIFVLLEPHHQVVLTSIDTINFLWQSSLEVDNDPLNYELRIFGTSWDTTINNIVDTTFQCIDEDVWQGDTEYKWTVSVSDGISITASPDTFSFTTPILDDITENNQLVPNIFALNQNYPNPFNPSTTIEYQLPASSRVDLSIYNALGQKVATMVSKKQPAGTYKVKWDGAGFVSGVYFYRLSAQGTDQNFIQTKKLMLLK